MVKHKIAYDKKFIDIPKNYQLKPVVAKHLETEEQLFFGSMKEAGEKGFCRVSISNYCRGNINSHKGYKWSYKE